jgi:hypothetical protein
MPTARNGWWHITASIRRARISPVARAYLYVNAFLYLGFSLWCTLSSRATAFNIGYRELSSGGRSEYLVVYGGLQLGLALIFCLLARTPERTQLGMVLAVALYAPIVAYRLLTLARFWPVSSVTLGTAVLELLLLTGAVGILLAHRRLV